MTRKISLLFITFVITLLGGNSAWAQGQANETYDFAAMSGAYTWGATYTGKGITNGQYIEKIGETSLNGRFAHRNGQSRGWRIDNSGLRCWGPGYSPELAICNLYEGDRIRITFSGGDIEFVYNDAAKINGNNVNAGDDLISGQFYTAVKNGDIVIKGLSIYTVITKVEIFYVSNKTYNFVGVESRGIAPGGDGANIDNKDGYKLNFEMSQSSGPYEGNFNHPDNFRFFVYQQGWKVNNSGLYYDGSENYSDFYILDVKKNDKVIVNFDSNDSDAVIFKSSYTINMMDQPMTSGTSYTMANNGNLHIIVKKGVHIQSIVIKSVDLRFSKQTDTYDLVKLDYTEPTLIGASGSAVTYSGNNPKVAIPNENTGDLMIVNTGDVTITASTTINGTTYSASYTLTVMAAESVWDVQNGNECYFPTTNVNNPTSNDNTGKLLMRRVTSVPHITMEFGDASNENLAMVTFRPDNNGVRAANLIDENGWQHIWMNHITTPGYLLHPYQGTFYKFQPTIRGKLTIKGIRNHIGSGANTIVLVDKDADASGDWSTDNRRTSIVDNNATYYSYPIVKTLSFNDNSHVALEEEIDLVGGHTYYLYANTPATRSESLSSDWQCFYLSGFKYETTFKFTHQNVVMGNSDVDAGYYHIPAATYYTQTINDAGQQANITYSIIRKGNISNNVSIDQNTGTISGITSNDHGAIVVTATLTGGGTTSKTSYVLTLPYTTIADGGSKRWVFNMADYNYNDGNPTGTNMMEQLEQLKTNAPSSEWTIKYKVRQYNAVTRALEYINVPVLANALDVRGDNARYIGTTEGLLFNADASSFGTTTGVRDDIYRITGGSGKVEKKENGEWVELTDAGDIDIALKTLLAYNADDAAGTCYYLTLENGSSMTIPNLKAGQHIRIKWSRYARNQGDLVTAYNVTDLGGNSMDGATITVGAGSNVNQNGGNGYHEFIVRNNGDVTFTVAQNGWINIYEIDIDGEFINTDLRLADGESLIRKQKAGEQFEHIYSIKWGEVLSQSNADVSYYIKDGSLTGTLNTDNCKVEDIDGVRKKLIVGSGGHGRFILVEEGRVKDSNNENISYVLDRKETLVKVYEYDYTPQSYPRTWNMENISATTVSALVADSSLVDGGGNYKTWKKADTNMFKMTLEPENLISWSTKATVDGAQTTINELNGLGIRPADITKKNNSIVFNNADHSIDVSGADAQILTVPNVTNNHTAYIRVKKGTGASVTAKYTANTTTADQPLTTVYDDGTYAVYKAPGEGKVVDGNAHIIDFYLNNVSVIQVAVSKDTKTISAAGYATEARNYPVDYTMTKTLDGHDYIAYKITGVSGNKVIATNVEYVPAGAGVMITGNETSAITRPIFTTDVNRSTSDMEGNLLIGLLSATEGIDQTTEISGNTYYNYILSKSGYNVNTVNGTPTTGDKVEGLGFYLLYKTGTIVNGTSYVGGTLKANSAYLRLTEPLAVHQSLDSGSGAPAMAPRTCFFIDFNGETTAIDDSINSSDVIRGEEGVYYTLQGVRVTTPTKGNVYILNGKKIFIK